MQPAATLTPKALALFSAALVALLALSGWRPYDTGTWVLEVAPVFVVLPILWFTHRRFPLTPLLYALIFVHACVLMLGGHYTYARVPLGEWMREVFALERNHYDRIGHFMQGFVPAIVARELLLRHTGLQRGGWLFTVVSAVALAVSAIYELIEWGAAVALGAGADEFLGHAGRRVGHAEGHRVGLDRRDAGPARAGAPARPATRGAGRSARCRRHIEAAHRFRVARVVVQRPVGGLQLRRHRAEAAGRAPADRHAVEAARRRSRHRRCC